MKQSAVVFGLILWGVLASPLLGISAGLRLDTDKDEYALGEEVRWTLYVWSDPAGDNLGLAGVNVNLHESRGEVLSPADAWGPDFGAVNGFDIEMPGTPGTDPQLQEISNVQMMSLFTGPAYDVGNDGLEHVFATGTFVPTQQGLHTLTADVPLGDYGDWQWTFFTASSPFPSTRTLGHDQLGPGDVLNLDGADATFQVGEQQDLIPEPLTVAALVWTLAGLGGYLRRR